MADDLVTIRQFQVLPEAEAARMHLRSAGVPCMLADAEAVNMDWALGNALRYIKLQVPRSQVQAALAALKAGASGRRSRKKRRRRGEEECLACGASLRRNQSRCAACGWSYLEDAESVPAGQPTEAEGEGAEAMGGVNVMESFRALRRPVLMLWLGPILLMLAIGILGLLALAWINLPRVR